MSDTDKLSFARSLRSSWRDEEEELTHESFEYAKRNITFIEYMVGVANEGYGLSISTAANRYEGFVYFVGKNYFSLVHNFESKSRLITTFPIFDSLDFVVRINKKQSRKDLEFKKISIEDKSFKAFLDEIAANKCECSLELNQEKLSNGNIELFKDFLRIKNSKSNKDNFIEQDSTIFSISSIVAITNSEI